MYMYMYIHVLYIYLYMHQINRKNINKFMLSWKAPTHFRNAKDAWITLIFTVHFASGLIDPPKPFVCQFWKVE